MLVLKDCSIEPGDILFVVSHSSKPLNILKQAAQAVTSQRSKHGHKEVISVFVCTGKNKYGVICHNFEHNLVVSQQSFIQTLQTKSVEELRLLLINYGSKEFNVLSLKKALAGGASWMKFWAQKVNPNTEMDQIINHLLDAIQGNKKKLIKLITTFWRASGQSDILPAVNSSLLLFKFQDYKIRKKFLHACLKQVQVTANLHAQGKERISYWSIFKAFFQWSSQDAKDKEKRTPADTTYCARHVMEILNQVDPNLVNRGRHVLPKSLEAGMRAATKAKKPHAPIEIEEDDFESLIANQAELEPTFSMSILPASGKELVSDLLAVIDQEIQRIENQLWNNEKTKKKAADLKIALLPFRDPKYRSYPVHLQVDIAVQILISIWPIVQTKTGILGAWYKATSYARVRAFARTQGIFDGDIREATEQFHKKQQFEDVKKKQIYIFSDWSFASWSQPKRNFMLEHMNSLLTKGDALYVWKDNGLVQMNQHTLATAINGEDFDDLLAAKLKPVTRNTLIQQAQKQHLERTKLHFLDYLACQQLVKGQEQFATTLNKVAPLFSSKIDACHLNQTKQEIIDIELENMPNQTLQRELEQLKGHFLEQSATAHNTYLSGIDTKPVRAQSSFRKPLFQSLDALTFTPLTQYYRNEVYTDLVINQNPSSPFHYFALQEMNALEDLVDCTYQVHPQGLTSDLLKKKRAESKLTLFQGKTNLCLTKNWQALPSIHPNETLLDIGIKGLKGRDFEIKYAPKSHLYYIRLKKQAHQYKNFSLHYLLSMPKEYRTYPLLNTIDTLMNHPEIYSLLIKYLKFGQDNGQSRNLIDITVRNGQEYLDVARELGIGSCRLRAIAFKEEMKRMHPEIPVCVIVNSDHCFIEMELDGLWKRYSLGGYSNNSSFWSLIQEKTVKKNYFFAEKSVPKVDNTVPNESRNMNCLKGIA